jgi:hypothetical protein
MLQDAIVRAQESKFLLTLLLKASSNVKWTIIPEKLI